MSRSIVFLDTETTGVHPGRKVWEVAMIKRDEHGDRGTNFFIEHVDLASADPYALRLGRFYERHPAYADTLTDGASMVTKLEAGRRVERWTRGATIVGLVPNFDTETLDKFLRSMGLAPAWDYHLIDIRSVAIGWLRGRGVPVDLTWSSDELAARCDVEPAAAEERHTALGDTRWLVRWWDRIVTDGHLTAAERAA